MKNVNFVVIILCAFSLCKAYDQFLTFYSGDNFQGDLITFKSKQPVISTDFAQFIRSSKSYQARGYWRVFSGAQYTGSQNWYSSNDMIVNGTHIPPYAGSLRHGGLLETNEWSISFYSDRNLMGNEQVFTTASNNITFLPLSLLATGNSSWTLHTGYNYDGIATCFRPDRENYYVLDVLSTNSSLWNVRSIQKGCFGRIDEYIFAEE